MHPSLLAQPWSSTEEAWPEDEPVVHPWPLLYVYRTVNAMLALRLVTST